MSEEAVPESTYEVGYRKPPTNTRFKPGQSGNPNGARRKRRSSVSSTMSDAFSERVSVTVNGKQKTMTKKELVVEQLIAKTLKGDFKALRKLLKLRDYVDSAGDFGPVIVTITEEESKCF